jgi:hypothetical protein
MYPNSDLSAVQLAVMAVVVVAALAAWLTLVMLAARDPGRGSAAADAGRRDEETGATVTRLPSGDRPPGKAALSGITPRVRYGSSRGRGQSRTSTARLSPGGVMTDPIARLREAGVSVWLDDLSRNG